MSSITAFLSGRHLLRTAVLASLALALVPSGARTQGVRAFEACTTGSLANCALMQITTGTEYGNDFFEIWIRNLGSDTGDPTSIYNLIFETGQPQNEGAGAIKAPNLIGDATTDGSEWDLFDSGNAIFLSALDNRGVGGCVAGSDVTDPDGNVFGQGGQTCDGFFAFRFSTTRLYDPFSLTLSDMQVVSLTNGAPAEFCDATTCEITPVAAIPEPASMLLAATGLSALAGWRLRRRRTES